MKRIMIAATAVLAVATTALAFSAQGRQQFSELLSGLKEAPQIVATSGTGTFKATINTEGTEIAYELTFNDLESDVRQAHIHLGWPQSNGNIVLWLCDSVANNSPVATTPACQTDPMDGRNGTVTGTLTMADVIPQAANGTPDWDEVVALIQGGRSYVNVHTAVIGAGEIRSQIGSAADAPGHPGGH
jgi:cystathionine beta-lyase family protein involved in aluminum resistance